MLSAIFSYGQTAKQVKQYEAGNYYPVRDFKFIEDTTWLKSGMEVMIAPDAVFNHGRTLTIDRMFLLLKPSKSSINALLPVPSGLFYKRKNTMLFLFTNGEAQYGEAFEIIGIVKKQNQQL